MSGPFNLAALLRRNAWRRADAEALVDDGRRWTYAELDREVDAHGHALLDVGVVPGDVVAIVGRNSACYVMSLLAIARIGAVSLPMNWRLHPRELAELAERVGATALVVDDAFADAAEAIEAVPSVRAVLVEGEHAGRWLPLATLLADARARGPLADADVGGDDAQRILFTSGTTSRPKGVIHTNANSAYNLLAQVLELELTPDDRPMITAPLFHVSGLEAPGYHTFAVGGTMVLTRSFGGRAIVELAARERVTGVILAAQILLDILSMDDLESFDLSALRYAIFAGVPPTVRAAFRERLPHVRTVDTFAMTELTSVGTMMDADHERSKVGSQGQESPFVQVRVFGDDDQPLPAGEVGEIVVRGPKVSPGYWNDPEATAAAWRDAWFRTGDMASIDEDGYLWFADRKSQMIRSGGENIASAQVERVIAEHPDVAEVAVIGVAHPRWEEVPKAYVVPRPGSTLEPQAIVAHCAASLGRFKGPTAVAVVATLPRNDSGKVLKQQLVAEAAGTEETWLS